MLKKEPYNKHTNIYQGPFIVIDFDESNIIIKDQTNNKNQKVHKNRLVKK